MGFTLGFHRIDWINLIRYIKKKWVIVKSLIYSCWYDDSTGTANVGDIIYRRGCTYIF